MALKRATVNVSDKVSGKNEIPVFVIPGNAVKRYNEADTKAKQAKADQDELKPQVTKLALRRLFQLNTTQPLTPADSIKLQDESGEMVRVSFTSRYSAADGDNASALFESIGQDVNEFAVENVVAKLDESVFLDANGDFSPAIYNEMKLAIDAVAAKFGKASPLSSKKVVQPKPTFHDVRWAKFNTVELQETVSRALPNTVQVVANVK